MSVFVPLHSIINRFSRLGQSFHVSAPKHYHHRFGKVFKQQQAMRNKKICLVKHCRRRLLQIRFIQAFPLMTIYKGRGCCEMHRRLRRYGWWCQCWGCWGKNAWGHSYYSISTTIYFRAVGVPKTSKIYLDVPFFADPIIKAVRGMNTHF